MLPVVSHEAKTYRWPYATVTLIGINVLAFVFELSVGARFVPFLQEWGLVPARVNAEVTVHNVLTLGTAMFLHVGWIHLIGNMWFLFVFGDAVEDAFGWRWFLAIYLLSGFFANIAFMVGTSGSSIPAIGASGAIAGVMGASLVLWPTARLKIPAVLLIAVVLYISYDVLVAIGMPSIVLGGPIIFIVSMLGSVVWYAVGRQRRTGQGFLYSMFVLVGLPAWVVLGLFFLTNLWSGALSVVSPAYGGAIGWWAHIGGFVAGALLAKLFPKHPIVLAKRAVLG
ncbi:MAG: rhomboid family intramembrane serine protease [Thermoleophilia bacterium]|jgi:membrane associated rhomboid family serine protease